MKKNEQECLDRFLRKIYIAEEQIPKLNILRVHINSKKVWVENGVSVDISAEKTNCISKIINQMKEDKETAKNPDFSKYAKYVGIGLLSFALTSIIKSTVLITSSLALGSLLLTKKDELTQNDLDELKGIVEEALKKIMSGFCVVELVIPVVECDHFDMYVFQLNGMDWKAEKHYFLKELLNYFALGMYFQLLIPEEGQTTWNLVQNDDAIILNTVQHIVKEMCGIEINDLTRMSSMTYEGAALHGDMLIGDVTDKGVLLEERIPFESGKLRQIVKLMQIGLSGYKVWLEAVTVNDENSDSEREKSMITALVPMEDAELAGEKAYRGKVTFLNGKGWILSSKNGTPLLEYLNGNFYIPDDNSDLNGKEKVLDEYFGSHPQAGWDNILKFVKNLKHGTILIFTTLNEARKEADRLTGCGRGYRINQTFETNTERLFEGLTRIDGALIFDMEGKCHAFGVIVDGEAGIAASQINKDKQGNPARGSRYNSALNYVIWKQNGGGDGETGIHLSEKESDISKKYAALVKSDDGSLDLLGADEKIHLESSALNELMEEWF